MCRVVPAFLSYGHIHKISPFIFLLKSSEWQAPFRFGAPVRATSRSPIRGSNSQTKGWKRVNGVRLLQSEL